MKLSGPQQGKVYEALLANFKEPELRRLLRHELDVELVEVAGGEDYRDVVDSLISCSCAEGWHLKLIRVACAKRPECPKLQVLAQEFLNQPKPTQNQATQLSSFPDVRDFDLRVPVWQAMEHLGEKSGLIGLAIPSVEATCLIKLCERLEWELGRRDTVIKAPLKLDYRTSAERVFMRVQRYQNSLSHSRNVICQIEISDSDEKNIKELWIRLFEKFQNVQTNNRLIIVFHGDSSGYLPTEVKRIKPPQFEDRHIWEWVSGIARKLDWQERTWRDWYKCTIDYCRRDEGEEDLDIFWVYEHLEFSMRLLQSQIPEQDFLQRLRSGP